MDLLIEQNGLTPREDWFTIQILRISNLSIDNATSIRSGMTFTGGIGGALNAFVINSDYLIIQPGLASTLNQVQLVGEN